MYVWCNARTQTNTHRPLQAGEMGAPVTIWAASRHDQPRPDDIRAHNDRHTIANDPGNLHAMSNHTKNDIQCAHRTQHHHPEWLPHK